VLATHIRPFFGLRLLREIDVALIREFVKTLIVKELSPKTISNGLGILKTMCKLAVRPAANPCPTGAVARADGCA